MSTYTDLHNRVKENITIDYHNRITPQKVRLFNEENEYWGIFQGIISGANSVMSGGTIANAVLSNVIFEGKTSIPGLEGFSVEELRTILNTLSNNLDTVMLTSIPLLQNNIDTEVDFRDTNDSVLCSEFPQVSTYVKAVSSDIVNNKLSNAISSLSTNLTNTISSISTELSTDLVTSTQNLCVEISTINIDLDTKIDSASEILSNYISAVNDTLHDVDVELSTHISDEIENRKSSDAILDATITSHYSEFQAHELSNKQEFIDTRKDLCATIEHERHYNFINKFSSYPYKLTDFAINSLEVDIFDGVVKYNSTENVGYIVDAGTSYTLVFNNINDYPELTQALKNGATFINLPKDGPDTRLYDNDNLLNGYMLKWDAPSGTTLNITLSTDSIISKVVKYDGKVIGRIANYSPSHSVGDPSYDISSGIVTIITDDTRFSAFNTKIVNKSFSSSSPAISSIDWNCRAQFDNSTQTLILEDGLDIVNFQNINDIDGIGRGRVCEGNVEYIDSTISSLSITLNDVINPIILNNENSFECQYLSTERLSAEIDGLSAQIACYETHNKWSYTLVAGSDPNEPSIVGSVVINNENISIDNCDNITSLCVVFDDDNLPITMLPNEFVVELTSTSNAKILSCEYNDIHGEMHLRFKYNKITNILTLDGSTAAGDIDEWKYSVRTAGYDVFNKSESYVLKWKTPLIDFSESALSLYHDVLPSVTYHAHIGTEILKSHDGIIKFSTLLTPQSEIKFYIPEQTDSTISREFILNGKFNRYGGSTADIKLGFYTLTKTGETPITIINHAETETIDIHDIIAKTNVPTTYQFNEISPNVFMAVNCEHYDTETISKRLDAETRTRTSDDAYLSSVISGEIIDRHTAIENLSASLSTTVDELTSYISSDVITISTDLDELEAHYSVNMSTDVEISALSSDGSGIHTVYTTVDQLLIADEVTYDLYRLTIRNGALNINKVGDISARFEHK